MPVNKVAENVFGTLGTICWSAQLVPQVWKTYREKSIAGLSAWLVLCWGISGAFLGVYAIVQNLNIPLIVQPQLFGFLCMVSWGQCQYYGSPRPKKLSLIISVATIALLGAFEVAMVFAVRPSSNLRAVQFFGIFSSVLLALGLVTQYQEIYVRKEVVGLSITFMTIDLLGGVFSDLSLLFKPKFDAIAAVSYTLVVIMDGVVILAAIILNPRARRRRGRTDADSGGVVRSNSANANGSETPGVRMTPSQRRPSIDVVQRHFLDIIDFRVLFIEPILLISPRASHHAPKIDDAKTRFGSGALVGRERERAGLDEKPDRWRRRNREKHSALECLWIDRAPAVLQKQDRARPSDVCDIISILRRDVVAIEFRDHCADWHRIFEPRNQRVAGKFLCEVFRKVIIYGGFMV